MAWVGQIWPQALQEYSQWPMRGTRTGVQRPVNPDSDIAGCNPPVGQTRMHSEQRMHLENRFPGFSPGRQYLKGVFLIVGIDASSFNRNRAAALSPTVLRTSRRTDHTPASRPVWEETKNGWP